MSFNLDDVNTGGQLKVGTGICPTTGEGATKINGSAMMEGPVVLGTPTMFPPIPYGTVNIDLYQIVMLLLNHLFLVVCVMV